MTSIVSRAVLLSCIAASAHAQTLAPLRVVDVPNIIFPVISPTGREVAAVCSDHTVRIMSVATGSILRTFETGTGKVFSLAYSRNGARLAMGYESGNVRVVDPASGATVRELAPSALAANLIALSRDGRYFATSPTDLPTQLWDVERSVKIADLAAGFGGSSALTFSPDGKMLASADADAVVRVYDVPSGKLRSKYEDLLLESFTLAFAPDSKSLVIGGADRVVVAIDPATGKELHRLAAQRDPVGAVAVLADGRTVVAMFVSADHMSEFRNTVAWNMQSGKSTILVSNKIFTGAAAPDGRMILASPEGKAMKLWVVR